MTVPPSSLALTVVIQLLLVAVIVRRSYSMSRGVPYSGLRLAVVPVLLVILWAATEVESLVLTPLAIPYLVPIDAALLVLTAVGFTPVAQRLTEVYRSPQGSWSYRIPFWVTGLFVAAFVARLGLAVALFPESLAFSGAPGGALPTLQQYALGAIDAIYSVSVGLLIGRSLGIRRKWGAAQANGTGAGAPD